MPASKYYHIGGYSFNILILGDTNIQPITTHYKISRAAKLITKPLLWIANYAEYKSYSKGEKRKEQIYHHFYPYETFSLLGMMDILNHKKKWIFKNYKHKERIEESK